MLDLIMIYLFFFKLGLFSFGGGYVVLPLLYQQLEVSGLIPISEFPDILALSQMTPGPIAVNAATYVGFRHSGLIGAAVATLGMLTPSLLLVLVTIITINRCRENLILKCIMDGVKPVTLGMISIAAVYFMEITIFTGTVLSRDIIHLGLDFFNFRLTILFILVFVAAFKLRVNPVFITIGSGLIAMLLL